MTYCLNCRNTLFAGWPGTYQGELVCPECKMLNEVYEHDLA